MPDPTITGAAPPGAPGGLRTVSRREVLRTLLALPAGAAANHIHGIYRDPTNDYGARYTQ